MVREKPFVSLDEQIKTLKARGLIIELEESSKRQLLKTSYYDLINGYKDKFLEEKVSVEDEDKFVKGTKFEDLIELYSLDREIRHVVMRASLDVECNFYTAIAYCISEKYGEKQENYLKKENYRRGTRQSKYQYERDNLLSRISRKIENPYEHPMKHYKEKYGNIPPWILVKHLSFGELIVWYKLSPPVVKNQVIKSFTGLEPDEKLKEMFLKSMELFNKFRNRAAHGGRIYNYKTNIEIPYNDELHKILHISKEQHNLGVGRSDFSSFLLSLLHLYQKDYFGVIEQIVILNNVLEKYKQESPLYYNGIVHELGLPIDYHNQILKKVLGK